MPDRTCVICFVPLTGRQQKLCGARPCRNRANRLRDPEKRRASKRRWNAAHGAEATRRWRQSEDGQRRERERNRGRGSSKKRMSKAARSEYVAARAARKRDRATCRLAIAAEGSTSRRLWIAGPCPTCDEPFVSVDGGRHCSRVCSPRRPKFTPAQRLAVHERDGWLCRLCGFPVDRSAAVPELEAPTIDHVIPLAAGGAHAPENWQTAHFWCNSYKSDRLDVA